MTALGLFILKMARQRPFDPQAWEPALQVLKAAFAEPQATGAIERILHYLVSVLEREDWQKLQAEVVRVAGPSGPGNWTGNRGARHESSRSIQTGRQTGSGARNATQCWYRVAQLYELLVFRNSRMKSASALQPAAGMAL